MACSLRLLDSKEEIENILIVPWWSLYLDILKNLQTISKLYINMENNFWRIMKQVKGSLCYLIAKFAEESEHYEWLFEHKEVTNFYIRRQLAMMMLPEVEDTVEDPHNMLIDRSKLLVDSFKYIATLDYLPGSFFVKFEEEQATGPGVLREWFLLACQEIFNPNNTLFIACPDDNRSFFPNQASEVNLLHLEYFQFSGRMIALALAYDVQIGVVFYRVFFLQLAGNGVLLEDIRDTDPFMYRSCKEILQKDAKIVDQDVLALTFVCEVESLGVRREIELCPNGKDIVVDSKNRETYVHLLIQYRYITSIAEQVAYFSKGFSDIVETMSDEQRKMLLFFWTSIKSLPFEGFGGLDSRLSIHKTLEPDDYLPSSHTCFYQLCFPIYQSMTEMEDQLKIITQGDIGSSFGTV
ncbi:E3 ubiquitin-protein ligase UPL5-like [Solanum tuberosum]|uniref:E3 ubiquitin-protein ligase UPL5-like n=1 Tax=Solanum tuberosum TaxID=4113 RepID=UPI00073A10B3|nr:PREDICTED: E3 ubiquitin-protein ligase UPL5-like [Solanum tuberosum]